MAAFFLRHLQDRPSPGRALGNLSLAGGERDSQLAATLCSSSHYHLHCGVCKELPKSFGGEAHMCKERLAGPQTPA